MVPELVDKYIFLVQTFVEAGDAGLSWPQVQRRWEARYGTEYPRRSFANHRAAVEEVFGITITCDRSTNQYRIDAGESAVDKREAVEYLINTFTVNSLLTLGKERLSGRVAVEDVPSGQKWLTVAMQAMLDNAVLSITYHKYLSTEKDRRTIRPYAVKEFAKRWYLVGYSEEAGALRTYALDRIQAMERTGDSFKMPKGFDVDALFRDSYGIYLPENACRLDDSRVHMYFDNALRFIRRRTAEYDLIIVDSTDPVGPLEAYFTREFYGICWNALREDGILVNQQGSPFYRHDAEAMQRSHKHIVRTFPISRVYQAHIPTYAAGYWLFGFASKKYHPIDDLNAKRWKALNLQTRYYTTKLHIGAFYLPAFLENLLLEVETL